MRPNARSTTQRHTATPPTDNPTPLHTPQNTIRSATSRPTSRRRAGAATRSRAPARTSPTATAPGWVRRRRGAAWFGTAAAAAALGLGRQWRSAAWFGSWLSHCWRQRRPVHRPIPIPAFTSPLPLTLHLRRHLPLPPFFHHRSDRKSVCYDGAASVVVMVTDVCPCSYPENWYSNKRWCCGDRYQ